MAGEQGGRGQRSRACVFEVAIGGKQLSVPKSNRSTSSLTVVNRGPHFKQLAFALNFFWQWDRRSRDAERCRFTVNLEYDRWDRRPAQVEIGPWLHRDSTDARRVLLVLKVHGKVANASPILSERGEAESLPVEVASARWKR